ncbi:TIGR03086 family metal-binding protein [Streptomyces sp. t39]|uniref:TIGR03086 family metal-binding protein n=1 Tax=Streptomyces sp. t39 TaxID=1828156 RepID=UPI0011CD663A|nr:TIGR03086 family metal-binding protein [Streptomyces sp. t39]TXS52438.1 TIGR03086 family protein [Streptomyces sp. t39]
MTNAISELLRTASERSVPVVRGIADDRLGDATPCAEYDVRQLVDHLYQVVVNFQALAAKKDADFSQEAAYVGHGDWRAGFAEEAGALVDAWAAPGADQGVTGQMNMPAPLVGRMVLGDLTVHAWDLARATGQEYAPDESVVGELLPAFGELAPTARAMGVFREEHPLPDGGEGVSDFDRLLALTGRDPQWRRP